MADEPTEDRKQKTENEKPEPSDAKAMEGKEKKVEEEKEEVEAKPEKLKKEKPADKPKAVKLNKKLQDLMDEIEKLSLLELADLVKALEEKFGAAPMVATPIAGAAPSETGEASASEQTTFNVVLASAGANKISCIKAVREINQTLGLKDAKDLVESCPKEILNAVNKTTAEEAKKKLEAAGATVELK